MKTYLVLLICLFTSFVFSQEKYRNFITKTDVLEKGSLALVLANNEYTKTTQLISPIKDDEIMIKTLNNKL